MKVVDSDEQRRKAVATFRRCHSYTKTCRELGYPSLGTLRVWVSQSRPGKKPAKKGKAPPRYGWQIKLEAVERMGGGQGVDDIAKDLKVDVPVLIYKWRTLWKKEGQWKSIKLSTSDNPGNAVPTSAKAGQDANDTPSKATIFGY